MKISINPHRCPQNHPCPAIRVCPTQAISQTGFGLPKIDYDACISCGKCIRFCPMGAFQATES